MANKSAFLDTLETLNHLIERWHQLGLDGGVSDPMAGAVPPCYVFVDLYTLIGATDQASWHPAVVRAAMADV